jgi:hypothetical protein
MTRQRQPRVRLCADCRRAEAERSSSGHYSKRCSACWQLWDRQSTARRKAQVYVHIPEQEPSDGILDAAERQHGGNYVPPAQKLGRRET